MCMYTWKGCPYLEDMFPSNFWIIGLWVGTFHQCEKQVFFSLALWNILFRSISNLNPPKKENQKKSLPFNLKVSWVKNPLALCKVGPSNMWEMVVTWMLICNALYKMLFAPQVSIVWESWCNTKQLANDFSKEEQLALYKRRAFRPWWNSAPYPFRMKRVLNFVLENGWCMANSGSYQVSGLTSRNHQGNNLKVWSRRHVWSFFPFKLYCQKLICKL
jgi:hypothetical protein